MYNFTNTNEIGEVQHSSIQTIFNGKNIDLQGFRTLTVTGRALIGKKIDSTDIPATDGKYFISSQLEPREITVKFQLKATNNEDYRNQFNYLNMLLHSSEPKELKFTDEEEYAYTGILQKVGSIEETGNTVVSTYSFLCLDPYKYKAPRVDIGVNQVTISKLLNNPNEVTPELIKIITASSGDKVIIKNQTTTQKIVINHTFVMGDILEIDLNANYPLKLNGNNKSALIDFLESDFDFTVKQNDIITINNCKRLEVHTKERLY